MQKYSKIVILLLNISEERRYGIFQEAEILEESGEFQNGSFELLRAMHKAKNKEPVT